MVAIVLRTEIVTVLCEHTFILITHSLWTHDNNINITNNEYHSNYTGVFYVNSVLIFVNLQKLIVSIALHRR